LKRIWLIKAREDKGFTHDKIAKMIGIKRSTYTRYESGSRTPKPEIAAKIAVLLNFDASNFFWPLGTKMVQIRKNWLVPVYTDNQLITKGKEV